MTEPRRVSDPSIVETYRKQLAYAKANGMEPAMIYLMWRGEPGITEDDLIDGLKAVEEAS